MTDQYWEQLVMAREELAARSSGSIRPSALMSRLIAPQESEANYTPPAISSHDERLSSKSGELTVRIYTPDGASSAPRPLLVWVHGGGWAGGQLDDPEADATSREVAARADAVVVSIGYRLASLGTHFPVPLDDVVAGYLWTYCNAAALGSDQRYITLGGASAGANLAAGAVLQLRDEGHPSPRAVVLAYGLFHPILPPPSTELFPKLADLSAEFAFIPEVYRPMVENYIGDRDVDATVYAMPGTAGDLSGFPNTYLFNCEYDGLRASGERFAQQLADAGVVVFEETIKNVAHANLARPGLAQARQSHRALAGWVRDLIVPDGARAVLPRRQIGR